MWTTALLLLAMMFMAGHALARDDGRWQILQARYGTDRQSIDVTDQLRETARRDARVRVTNALFRDDPAPGRMKTLRISARDSNGSVRTFDYDEGAWIDGARFTGWGRGDWGRGGWTPDAGRGARGWQDAPARQEERINIVRAEYGTPNQSFDVTERVRWLSRSRGLDARVSPELVGMDPAPGRQKRLRVYYRAGGNEQQTVDVWDGQQLRLP